MQNELVIIKSINLLWNEYLIGQGNSSKPTIKLLVDKVALPPRIPEVVTSHDALMSLREVIFWMWYEIDQKKLDYSRLRQKVRIATKDFEYLFQTFLDGNSEEDDPNINRQVINQRREISDALNYYTINEVLTKAQREIAHGDERFTGYRQIIRNLVDVLEPYTMQLDGNEVFHQSVMRDVDFNNQDNVLSTIKQTVEYSSGEGVLKTGWQGLNRLLGEPGGFRRGEMTLVGALPHNFKSGLMLSLFKHFAMYNEPYMIDPDKKPLILFLSLENELEENTKWLYENIRGNELKKPVSLKTEDLTLASQYIMNQLGKNGYINRMLRLDPHNTTFFDIRDIILKLENEGYEIHALFIDYLAMAQKESTGGPMGADLQNLFLRLRNFTSPRKITLFTPHQLSGEAVALNRQGVDDFAKKVAGQGYYKGCRGLDQDPDLELIIHIERRRGLGAFLTFARGKHRGVDNTPEEHKSVIYKFESWGNVPDDILGEDQSLKEIVADGTVSDFFN